MPVQHSISPLGAFLKALAEEKIPCILIGMMAAVEQGAPLMTVDYDFWVKLPERQYVRILQIIKNLRGVIMAPTFYELSDGTQVNVVFKPTGLRSFDVEFKAAHERELACQPIRVLPLKRVIASKRAAGRDKDVAVLPVLERTMRLGARLKSKKRGRGRKSDAR
jgi:hypothetical protein